MKKWIQVLLTALVLGSSVLAGCAELSIADKETLSRPPG